MDEIEDKEVKIFATSLLASLAGDKMQYTFHKKCRVGVLMDVVCTCSPAVGKLISKRKEKSFIVR